MIGELACGPEVAAIPISPAPDPTTTGGRRRLRVAMVHISDYRLDSRIQRLATALAQRGDDVDLFCIGEPDEIHVGDGRIRTHAVMAAKPSGGAAAYVRGYGRFIAGAARQLTSVDRRQPFDVIEAHNMPDALTAAAIVPRLRGTPVILNVHDTFPELFATKFGCAPGHPLVRLARLEERLGARLANRVVTVTDEARRCLDARGVGGGQTVVVMNSADEAVFGPPSRPRPIPATGPIRVLYHGGLAPRYGVETLIRAIALLAPTHPRIELRVCGMGTERSALARLAEQVAPGRVAIPATAVPFAQIPDELRAADIGVVPTLCDSFTELLLPVKLLEYVHCGLPVVASRLPGIAGYFSDQDLLSFTPGDSRALAGAIAEVCRNPDASRARAVNASLQLEDLSWERQKAGYLALVDQLAGVPRRARH